MRDEAIRKAYPNVVTITIDSTETIALDKDDKVVSLDDTKISEEEKKLKAEWDAQAYARTRRPLYPDIGDQLDDLYKKGAFSDEMAAKIKKVKDDNPKLE